MRPIAERHGLTPLQLACAWNLAHAPVRCVAPTLIQEPGDDARPIEAKRAELAAVPAGPVLTRRRGRRDPRDRRQHGQHGAQGRRARLRRRAAARPLAARRRARRGRGPLGHRARARISWSRLALSSRPDPEGSRPLASILIAGILLLALAGHGERPRAPTAAALDTRRELAEVDIAETVETRRRTTARREALPEHVVRRRAHHRRRRATRAFARQPAAVQGRLRLPQRPRRTASPSGRDALQADVSLIGRFMGAQSGGRKTPRFDMGTSCGPEYVDVQVVQLPRRAAPPTTRRLRYRAQAAVRRAAHARPATAQRRGVRRHALELAAGRLVGPRRLLRSTSAPARPTVNNQGGLFSTLCDPRRRARPRADRRTAGGPRGCCTR